MKNFAEVKSLVWVLIFIVVLTQINKLFRLFFDGDNLQDKLEGLRNLTWGADYYKSVADQIDGALTWYNFGSKDLDLAYSLIMSMQTFDDYEALYIAFGKRWNLGGWINGPNDLIWWIRYEFDGNRRDSLLMEFIGSGIVSSDVFF